MRPPLVVVGGVGSKYPTQVLLPEDQHPVDDLGPHRQHEPFGETVRPRAPRRNPNHLDTGVRQDRVERRRELSGPIADEEPKPGHVLAEIHHQVAGLLGRPGPSGCPVTPSTCRERSPTSSTNSTYSRRRVTAQSTWKMSTASMLVAWVRRNCRQLVSVRRTGAGGMRWRLRMRRIVEAPTRWPSLSNSPCSRWYPHPGFSSAMRTTKAVRGASIGVRPVRCG